jgi:hypothetical protein
MSRDSSETRCEHFGSPVTQNGPNGLRFHGTILSVIGFGVGIEQVRTDAAKSQQ